MPDPLLCTSIESSSGHESQPMVPYPSIHEGEAGSLVPPETHLLIRNAEQHDSERTALNALPASTALQFDDTTMNPNQAYVLNLLDSNLAPLSYHPPTLEKQLKSTNHPRTFKDFAESGSAPISCLESAQREPVPIAVRSSSSTSNGIFTML